MVIAIAAIIIMLAAGVALGLTAIGIAAINKVIEILKEM